MNPSWKLSSNIKEQNTLFNGSEINYDIDLFYCVCGHNEYIIRDIFDISEYRCKECENEKFLDANSALDNYSNFYHDNKKIDNAYIYAIEKSDEVTSSVCYLTLPERFDLISEEIFFKKLYIYKLSIDSNGKISKEFLLNIPKEKSKCLCIQLYVHLKKNKCCSQRKTDKQLERKFKMMSLNESLFLKYSNIIDYEFVYWDSIDLFLGLKEIRVLDALELLLNGRKEKSIKKSLYESYEYHMKHHVIFISYYVYTFTKYIQDPNIVTKLIKLDLPGISNGQTMETFIFFLKEYGYKDIQVYNILRKIGLNKEYLSDTVSEVNLYKASEQATFRKVSANIKIIHDTLLRLNERFRYREIYQLDRIFKYRKEIMQKCIKIENYIVSLPKSGEELYNYAEDLQNCMASYCEAIYNNSTSIYFFFKEKQLSFAVEIRDNEVVQASKKFNAKLEEKDQKVLDVWLKQFNIKSGEMYEEHLLCY